MVFKDLVDVTSEIMKNREQLEKIDANLVISMRIKQHLLEIIGKFIQML